jgi:hypothetical protein
MQPQLKLNRSYGEVIYDPTTYKKLFGTWEIIASLTLGQKLYKLSAN